MITAMTAPAPWQEVNEADARQVAELLGLERAREAGKYACPVHGGSDSLHAYRGNGRGFYCWGACQRKFSNVDLAAAIWSMEPADACRELAGRLGILVLEPKRAITRQNRVKRARAGTPTPAAPPRPVARPTANTDAKPEPAEFAELRADGYFPQQPPSVYADVLALLPLTDRGADYLHGRGLNPDNAREYGFRSLDGFQAWEELGAGLAESFLPSELEYAGLHSYPWGGRAPALLIPYRHAGQVVGVRFRNLTPDTPHGMRYRDLTGAKPPLPFNADALGGAELHIVEGELNAYTLHLYGLAAIGLPGVHGWREEWAGMLRTCSRLVAWYDADNAGEQGRGKLAATIQGTLGKGWLKERGRSVRTPQDANDLHRKGELHAHIERAPWRV